MPPAQSGRRLTKSPTGILEIRCAMDNNQGPRKKEFRCFPRRHLKGSVYHVHEYAGAYASKSAGIFHLNWRRATVELNIHRDTLYKAVRTLVQSGCLCRRHRKRPLAGHDSERSSPASGDGREYRQDWLAHVPAYLPCQPQTVQDFTGSSEGTDATRHRENNGGDLRA